MQGGPSYNAAEILQQLRVPQSQRNGDNIPRQTGGAIAVCSTRPIVLVHPSAGGHTDESCVDRRPGGDPAGGTLFVELPLPIQAQKYGGT